MTKPNFVFVGIDWADSLHAFHLCGPDGRVLCGEFKQDPKVIDQLVNSWKTLYPQASIVVAIETSKGPIITVLLKQSDITIYPINPAALASYRKAFAHGGGKNDPSDAMRLAEYLVHCVIVCRAKSSTDITARRIAECSSRNVAPFSSRLWK